MRLTCTVCRDLLVSSDIVNVAPCGHYLHYLCWMEWLERSSSCPQCRKKTTAKQLVKLFFNVADAETNEPDTNTLTERIDSLTFQIQCKSKDLENTKLLLEKQQGQNDGLREEVKRYRAEVEKVESENTNLQERISYLQQQSRVADEKKKEADKLRKKLERLENLETVLRGSSAEVERLVGSTSCSPDGIRSLALFTGSLKKALEESTERKKQLREFLESERAENQKLRNEVRSLKSDLETAESNTKRLTDEISQLEEEKKSLSKKVTELEAAIISPTATSVANKALRRLIAESPAPALNKSSNGMNDSDILGSQYTPVRVAPARSVSQVVPSGSQVRSSTSQAEQRQEYDSSPFFGVKPKVVKGTVPVMKRPLVSSNISIFNDRLKSSKAGPVSLNTSLISGGYDGLGGHSKIDEYPEPKPELKKAKMAPKVLKKKLSAPPGVPKLSQFGGFLEFD